MTHIPKDLTQLNTALKKNERHILWLSLTAGLGLLVYLVILVQNGQITNVNKKKSETGISDFYHNGTHSITLKSFKYSSN